MERDIPYREAPRTFLLFILIRIISNSFQLAIFHSKQYVSLMYFWAISQDYAQICLVFFDLFVFFDFFTCCFQVSVSIFYLFIMCFCSLLFLFFFDLKKLNLMCIFS